MHSRDEEFAYRDPQFYVHRLSDNRVLLTPSPGMAIAPPRGYPCQPENVRFLFCSACEKYRRVDPDTLATFSNRVWKLDALAEARDALQLEHPQLFEDLPAVVAACLASCYCT